MMQKIPGHRHRLLCGSIPINVLHWFCFSGTQELFGVMEPDSACGRSHKTGHRSPGWWQSCFRGWGTSHSPVTVPSKGQIPFCPHVAKMNPSAKQCRNQSYDSGLTYSRIVLPSVFPYDAF